MDLKKLQGMANYPVLQNVTDVRAFLGFTGYYRYFVQNYSAIVHLLLDLTKKGSIFNWESCHQEAFDKIKAIMCKAPVLLQPDFNKKFYLQTDASAYGMGAVLSQEGETTLSLATHKKPVLHPITYFSATFTPTEHNYNIYKRELLAVMKALAVTAYFDLSSYLYLSRLIHDASLIIPELSVLLDCLYCSYIHMCAHVNAYRTYPLSRYLATILLNTRTRVSATYLPIPYRYSHAHSPSWSTHSESYPPLYP